MTGMMQTSTLAVVKPDLCKSLSRYCQTKYHHPLSRPCQAPHSHSTAQQSTLHPSTVPTVAATNYHLYDGMRSLMWSDSYGFLEKGDDLCLAESAPGETKEVHAMETFQRSVWFSVFCAHLPLWAYTALRRLTCKYKATQAAEDFGNTARYKTNKRLKSTPAEPDIFSHLPVSVDHKGRPPMPMREIVAEPTVMLNAGNDTTQTTLTNNLFLLATHPATQTKLRTILLAHVPAAEQPVASYSTTLAHIPYLRAVLDETFRVLTPQRFGLPRRTTDATTIIAGHAVAPGVTVSSPLSELHGNPELFSGAGEWVPERWMAEGGDDTAGFGEAERGNLREYVMPFTTGARACIGRNLAYVEVSIALAALVMTFEWRMGEGCFGQFERITSNPTMLFVKAKAV